MASMVFAPSPLSVQSLVKLRTNSNYPRSSCYVPLPSKTIKNSYVHLYYNNISHIDLSKSSFTKGDVNFSFPLPKFPKLSSTLSPSLNIIKASGEPNIYRFRAVFQHPKEKAGKYIQLGDEYYNKVLLIVNIPDNGSRWAKSEIKFLNDLRSKYIEKSSLYKLPPGFEVLGFLHDKNDLTDKSDSICGKDEIPMEVEEILREAEFPIFQKVKVNDNHEPHWYQFKSNEEKDRDLWYFLRTNTPDYDDKLINQEFEKFLVDGEGIPVKHFVRYDYERVQSQSVKEGEYPGELGKELRPLDPTYPVEDAIKVYFKDSKL